MKADTLLWMHPVITLGIGEACNRFDTSAGGLPMKVDVAAKEPKRIGPPEGVVGLGLNHLHL